MKKIVLLIIGIAALFSCRKEVNHNDYLEAVCVLPTTSMSLEFLDFYSKQPLGNMRIKISGQPFWSPYGPDLVAKLDASPSGILKYSFDHDSLTSYYFDVLLNADTSYIYPWRTSIKTGCSHEWKILMKPVHHLTVTLKNDGPDTYSTTYLYVNRWQKDASKYQNPDIDKNLGYSFGTYLLDSVPLGFEQQILFKVVPEEEIEIQFGTGDFKKVQKIRTDASNASAVTFSI